MRGFAGAKIPLLQKHRADATVREACAQRQMPGFAWRPAPRTAREALQLFDKNEVILQVSKDAAKDTHGPRFVF